MSRRRIASGLCALSVSEEARKAKLLLRFVVLEFGRDRNRSKNRDHNWPMCDAQLSEMYRARSEMVSPCWTGRYERLPLEGVPNLDSNPNCVSGPALINNISQGLDIRTTKMVDS